MYNIPNTVRQRHLVNWPTYNTKSAKKKVFFSKNPQTFATEFATKKGILGNN